MLTAIHMMLPLCAIVLAFYARAVTVKVLPLGDSITWGYQGSEPHSSNGYRKQLKDRLFSSGISTDFIGTQSSGPMEDNENEGHPGWTIRQIQSGSENALKLDPDVVLLHAGTNDLNKAETEDEPYSGAPARLRSLIDAVFQAKPNVTVLVARITLTNNGNTNRRIFRFNVEVQKIVDEMRGNGRKIMVADQGWVKEGDLGDGLHPNGQGYIHMGNIWYDAFIAARNQGWIET
ncbi:SGNH hydrolase [Massarina eburnea CBS 473.64]|uniref:SGNH hydrolase n=1 Tax=Massarina eburnea CBS 473.64 TaxID=1395130 RepID=A0A6A6RWN9_9PLEO|nr:SGNH hydrolase [Massarina eburnea CBS 473.64]